MHATLPLLEQTDFPALSRGRLDTLQVNLGYLCNQQCLHCHVNAGPKRREIMNAETISDIKHFISHTPLSTLDLTGGAPEMNPHFRDLVRFARQQGLEVIDRCNLTILQEDGQQDLAEFLAAQGVTITASLPCYLEDNVNRQRGKGVFSRSITALQQLNKLGYGQPGSGRQLHLVYNPQGPVLPPPQQQLEQDYKEHLATHYNITFNQLFTLSNMPIKRFGSMLVSTHQFADYMQLLRNAYSDTNLQGVMCRNLVSIDWQGYVYDCDFNQMLDLPAPLSNKPKTHIRELLKRDLQGLPIVVKNHCYACTAGQGSSCGGALN